MNTICKEPEIIFKNFTYTCYNKWSEICIHHLLNAVSLETAEKWQFFSGIIINIKVKLVLQTS